MMKKQMASNPVAKYAHTVNRCRVFRDRKSASKRGYRKHRGVWG